MQSIVQTSKENKKVDKDFTTEFNLINEILNDSRKMDSFGFSELSHYDLSQVMISSPVEDVSLENTSIQSVTSPGLDTPDFDISWYNEIDDCDLIGKEAKHMEFTKEITDKNILEMTSDVLYGTGLGQFAAETSVCDLSSFTIQSRSYVVAPLKVQPIPEQKPVLEAPILPVATTSSSRKRKEILSPRALPAYSVEDLDIKPSLHNIPIPTANTRGRKRTSSIASNNDVLLNAKKVKKYDLDPAVDPTVKNARAAKANRERKKQEVNQMKEESQRKDDLIKDLLEKLEKEKLEKEKYKKERDSARETNSMTQGLRGVATNIREFIQCVIPPMNSSFGGMDVQIPEWFSGITLGPETGTITGIDPAIQERFDLQPNQEPSRYFTAHVNLGENVMKIEYNPRAGL